jgi:glutathione S-transferase
MPILIQRLIFENAPKNAPFWMRPIVNQVFAQLNKLLVEPEIKKNLTMVCCIFYEDFGFDLIPVQIESHLEKSKSVFFAGGQEPTVSSELNFQTNNTHR